MPCKFIFKKDDTKGIDEGPANIFCTVVILDFAGHIVFVETTRLCCYNLKAATDNT